MNKDLNDPLDELFGGASTGAPRPMTRPEMATVIEAGFAETCPSCRGRGRFISYAGRDCGPCFKCKGKGKQTFKSSPEKRAGGRAKATEKRDNAAQEKARAAAAWLEANKTEAAWMAANGGFAFAVSMLEAVMKFGSLTENQLAAVRRCIARDTERKATRDAERAAREAAAPTVEGVDLLKAAFDKAVAYSAEKGLKLSPRITVGGITISPAKANSKNPDALYVKSGDDYLGKIAGGKFHTVLACTAEQQAKVLAFVANPAEAAKVYGQTTGTCCVCNATLISKWKHRGIGPICAEKFGWAE